MKLLLPLLLSLFACSCSALYTKKGPVLIAGRDEVKALMGQPAPFFLEFFAPWCGHCKSLAPHYTAAAKKMQGLVTFAAVDCDVEANKKLCGQFGVKGFPTVLSFPASKAGAKKGKPSPYQGARQSGPMMQHAVGLLVDETVTVTSDSVGSLRGGKAALLFSDKKKATSLAKGLALAFLGRLPVGLVHSSEKELAEEFGVTEFPALVVLNGEGDGKHSTYTGKLKAPAILEFLSGFAPAAQTAGGAQKEPEPEVVYDKELKEIRSSKDFTDDCAQTKGLCAIAFLDPEDGDASRHEGFVNVLKELIVKHYKNLRFRWANGPEQYEAYQAFKLGGGFPALVIYSGKKTRVIPFRGSFSVEDISQWIGRALRGLEAGTTLSKEEVPQFEVYVDDEEEEEQELEEEIRA